MKKNSLFIPTILIVITLIWFLQEPSKEIQHVKTTNSSSTPSSDATLKKLAYPASPELAGITGYINTANITIGELIGKKVILIDFWTYSCINCQRTLPYITRWYEKYKGHGLEIIGVHAPEFNFEKNIDNVQRAVAHWNITYPIVLDNDHETWAAFQNNYWPRKYMIDIDGYVVWNHIGEGNYDETERKIQELLTERQERLGLHDNMKTMPLETLGSETEFSQIITPEIYLGHDFTRGNFGNAEGLPPQQEVTYHLPSERSPNTVYLEGQWFVDKDHVRLVSSKGKITLTYHAKKANIVAGSVGSDITPTVDGTTTLKQHVHDEDLYTIASPQTYDDHTLELSVSGAGFRLYTFTFG